MAEEVDVATASVTDEVFQSLVLPDVLASVGVKAVGGEEDIAS